MINTWTQNYNPLNAWLLSTLVSSLPVLTLFFVLIVLKERVWVAALSGLLMASLVALAVFHVPPMIAVTAASLGVIFGLLRIAWIIVCSIFLYNVACETGQFDVMKASIAALSSDRRLQVILIAFCFGAFLEGTGGGGAPVAIAGAFLIGLGFEPFQAATLCLLANTAPVAWGGVGNPIRTLAAVSGLPEHLLSSMAGRILPPISMILPAYLVRAMVGWRQTIEVWPALAVCGVSFAAMQFYWSNFQESGLVDIVAAIFSLLCLVAFLKVWQPQNPLVNHNALPGSVPSTMTTAARHSTAAVLKGWSPFILASIFIFVTGLPSVNRVLSFDALRQPMPFLHNSVMRVPPVAPAPSPEPAIADLNFIGIPGTAIFVATILSALLPGLSVRTIVRIFGQTVVSMVPSLLAISFMVGLAFLTRYSGMDTVLGLSMTRTGRLFPFFGTLLGWIGVALTGTDAGSNALFGNLQRVTAEQLGLSAVLMCAANSCGGVMGKMIDAQSIVVSSTATRQAGNEAAIFKAVFTHSIFLASVVGVIVLVYAFLLPELVPR
jgi:lactate permease